MRVSIFMEFLEAHVNIMNETLKISGRVKMECRDQLGNLKWKTGWISNGITNAGKAQLALLAGDATAVPFTYLEVGTSATAFGASQTTLVAEITDTGLARVAATVTRVTTTVTNDTLQLTGNWSVTGAKTVEEVGMFNASSSGTMLGRALTGTKVLANLDVYTIIYQVKMS